ncbi:Phox homologous domain-containing protein [Lyophyllum atratum]|nr:Phox homologous domain-containing protein [Lyophyllum atratum]
MASPQASSSSVPEHPFANSKNLLEIIPDKIDIEEESRLYDELAYDNDYESRPMPSMPTSFQGPPSIFSKDIWMDDKTGEALAFARDVSISGWTNVGDKPEGAYIVYDCTIQTKEGTVIHAHKRYRDFAVLESALRHTLPAHQRHFIPVLPPKTPLSRYRPAFLDRRRRRLQAWLSAVLLHPDVGGAPAVRLWVMN